MPDLTVNGSVRISDFFNSPQIIEDGNNADYLFRGLFMQAATKAGHSFDPEIAQYLFRGSNKFGGDLFAIDVQRGRDHGIATYNNIREFCGLPKAKSWNDYSDLIPQDRIDLMKTVYKSHEDVDLKVGGILERRQPDSQYGPTFTYIIAMQFYKTRTGDRFFFENENTNFTQGRYFTFFFK